MLLLFSLSPQVISISLSLSLSPTAKEILGNALSLTLHAHPHKTGIHLFNPISPTCVTFRHRRHNQIAATNLNTNLSRSSRAVGPHLNSSHEAISCENK